MQSFGRPTTSIIMSSHHPRPVWHLQHQHHHHHHHHHHHQNHDTPLLNVLFSRFRFSRFGLGVLGFASGFSRPSRLLWGLGSGLLNTEASILNALVPFLGTLNNGCRIIIGTQKGTIILTTAHVVQECSEPLDQQCGDFEAVRSADCS